MRLLHDIRIPNQEAWVWGSAVGANGIALGEPRRGRWDSPLQHSFLLGRGTPTRIPVEGALREWPRREYWYPWSGNPVALLRPTCGPLRTQSRNPQWQPADTNDTWNVPRICPNCQRLQPTTTHIRTLRQTDPWTTIPTYLRPTTLDPVTGM